MVTKTKKDLIDDIEHWAGSQVVKLERITLQSMSKRQLDTMERLCEVSRSLGVQSGKMAAELALSGKAAPGAPLKGSKPST